MYAVKLAYPISKGKALIMRLLQSVAFHIVSTSKLKFPIGGEHVTCHWSKLTSSLEGKQNSLTNPDHCVLIKEFALEYWSMLLIDIVINTRSTLILSQHYRHLINSRSILGRVLTDSYELIKN